MGYDVAAAATARGPAVASNALTALAAFATLLVVAWVGADSWTADESVSSVDFSKMSAAAMDSRDRLRAKQKEYQQAHMAHSGNQAKLRAEVDELNEQFAAAQRTSPSPPTPRAAAHPTTRAGSNMPLVDTAAHSGAATLQRQQPIATPPPVDAVNTAAVQMTTTFASGMILQHTEPIVAGFCASASTKVEVVLSAESDGEMSTASGSQPLESLLPACTLAADTTKPRYMFTANLSPRGPSARKYSVKVVADGTAAAHASEVMFGSVILCGGQVGEFCDVYACPSA